MTSDAMHETARTAQEKRPFRLLARLGYAVSGLLHFVVGAIAIAIASGEAAGPVDESGALDQLSDTPGGVFLLWTVVVGLAALGLWNIAQAILVPAPDPKRRWAHRFVELGEALIHFAVAAAAFIFAIGHSTYVAEHSQDFSGALLAAPGGVFLLGLIGFAVIAVGGFFCLKGVVRRFTRDISVPAGALGRIIVAAGVIGYVAKGIAITLVGILFVGAAITYDTDRATGLDGALKALVALPYGPIILIVIGAGFIAYGAYSAARALIGRL